MSDGRVWPWAFFSDGGDGAYSLNVFEMSEKLPDGVRNGQRDSS